MEPKFKIALKPKVLKNGETVSESRCNIHSGGRVPESDLHLILI